MRLTAFPKTPPYLIPEAIDSALPKLPGPRFPEPLVFGNVTMMLNPDGYERGFEVANFACGSGSWKK